MLLTKWSQLIHEVHCSLRWTGCSNVFGRLLLPAALHRWSSSTAAITEKTLPFFFPPHKIIQAVFLLNKSSVACNKSSDNAVVTVSVRCSADPRHTAHSSCSPLCWVPHITWAVPIPPHPEQRCSCVWAVLGESGVREGGHRRTIPFKKRCPVLLFSSLATSGGAGAFCPSLAKK